MMKYKVKGLTMSNGCQIFGLFRFSLATHANVKKPDQRQDLQGPDTSSQSEGVNLSQLCLSYPVVADAGGPVVRPILEPLPKWSLVHEIMEVSWLL